jgi:hypothetical protein
MLIIGGSGAVLTGLFTCIGGKIGEKLITPVVPPAAPAVIQAPAVPGGSPQPSAATIPAPPPANATAPGAALAQCPAAAPVDAAGQRKMGDKFYDGDGVERNYQEAAKWYQSAVSQGDSDAMLALGGCYAAGKGVPLDYAAAARLFLQAATQGNSKAQLAVSLCCQAGKGMPRDDAEALRWLELAAAQNNPAAVKMLEQRKLQAPPPQP